MGYHRRRHKRTSRNGLGSVIGDFGAFAGRVGPAGALTAGILGFAVLYLILPQIIAMVIEASKSAMTGPSGPAMGKFVEQILSRRFIQACEWARLAVLILCTAMALWKAVSGRAISSSQTNRASALSRLVSRLLD